jgi:hypothetical protein
MPQLVPHPFLPLLGFRAVGQPAYFEDSVSRMMLAMLDLIQAFSLDSHAVITTSRTRAVSQAEAAVGPTLMTVPVTGGMPGLEAWSDPRMLGYLYLDSSVFVQHHPGGQEAALSWLRLFAKYGNRGMDT